MSDTIDLAPAPELTTEEKLNETVIKKAAAMAAAGVTKAEIGRQLGLSQYWRTKLYKDELFKKTVAEIGEDAVSSAKAFTRGELSRLAKKAVTAIEKNLDKHSLEAAKTVLRALGLEQAKEDDNKQGGFTLVLANQKQPQPAIVVKKENDE